MMFWYLGGPYTPKRNWYLGLGRFRAGETLAWCVRVKGNSLLAYERWAPI